jgi:hypothetical protein
MIEVFVKRNNRIIFCRTLESKTEPKRPSMLFPGPKFQPPLMQTYGRIADEYRIDTTFASCMRHKATGIDRNGGRKPRRTCRESIRLMN